MVSGSEIDHSPGKCGPRAETIYALTLRRTTQWGLTKIHRRKPKGKPMSEAKSRTNGKKSSIRARVEHAFSHQKNRYGLFIRTIGLERAEAKLALANIAYNMDRL